MTIRDKRIWRKRLTRAILCLLLGAVTTVGVAWGLVVFGRERVFAAPAALIFRYDPNNRRACWPSPVHEDWPREQTEPLVHTDARVGLTARHARESITPEAADGMLVNLAGTMDLYQLTVEAGWPVRATALYRNEIWSHGKLSSPAQPSQPADLWENVLASMRAGWALPHGGLRIPTAQPAGAARPIYLPIVPMWPGFLLDTLFYAALWSLALITPGAILRFRRRRRSRCVHCGYDLTGLPSQDSSLQPRTSSPCPECGT